MALAQLLAPGSTIYAVDLDRRTLEGIPDQHNGVEIRKIVGDLQSFSLRLPQVDGILMANTLHFIQEQQALLRRLLSVADRFLIVEYERSRPNRWGPYPVGFERLRQLFSEAGVEARGEPGDTALAVWRHDVLGPRREIQTIILNRADVIQVGRGMLLWPSFRQIDLQQMTVRRATFKLLRAVLRATAIVSPAAILIAGRVTGYPEVMPGHKSVIGQMKSR